MKKRGILLTLVLWLTSLTFISAYGYYGGGSISDYLYRLNSQDVTLIIVFIIAFTLIYAALSNAGPFRQNTGGALVIALGVSFGIIFALNQTGTDLTYFIYNLGISEGMLTDFFWIATLVIIIGFVWKFGIKGLLVSLGVLSIALGFFFEERALLWIIGAILLGIGIKIKAKKKMLEQLLKSV